MNYSVTGIGWLTGVGYGSLIGGTEYRFAEGESVASLVRLGLFSLPFKNFGRLDPVSRTTVSAVALALKDAGIDYSTGAKLDMGIIGTGREGSLKSDSAYFRDFVDNGRTLSRANLFIYTLPSSPIGEAAIHFGLTGPLLYTTGVDGTLDGLFDLAGASASPGEPARMLVGLSNDAEAVYLVIDRNDTGSGLCTLVEARSVIGTARDVKDVVARLSKLKMQKGTA